MSSVNFLQILKGYALLSLPISLSDSFQTQLWGTAKVDYPFQSAILTQLCTHSAINCIFALAHVPLPIHQLPEYLTICQGRPFCKMKLLRVLFDGVVPKETSGMDSVELEGKSPAFGIFVVALQKVLSGHVLPFLYWLLDGLEIKQLKQGSFSCSQIALDRNYS